MVLNSTREVIEALGGLDEVARLTGSDRDAVWNWLKRSETFPSKTFVVLTGALEGRGYEAPPSLWRMVEPAQ